MNEEHNQKLLIPSAIIAAGLIIAFAVMYSSGSGSKGASGNDADLSPSTEDSGGTVEINIAGAPFLGSPDAPVTVVEFADFQCPFCGRMFRETVPQIMENYIKTGKVKFVYKDFAFLGRESQRAAEAAKCAMDQDKFWEYHDFLYNYLWDNYYAEGQNGENVGAFSDSNLKRFARDLGLNTSDFNTCFDSGKYADVVSNDIEDGKAVGARATPTSFVNGRIIEGAVPYATFSQAIEEALSAR